MKKKDLEIIQYIFNQYIDLYDKKDMFNSKYFKFKKEDALYVLNNIDKDIEANDNIKKTKEKKTVELSDNIASIKTEEEVEKYYLTNLIYKHDDENSKKKILKHISVAEIKYLYKILYKTECKGRANKVKILEGIEKYFENKNRALYLKGL
ncbi:hypothetical protein [Clostridium sp. D53t1_180928_C8]|uniref:hypothetical protein n=1 Tax=Clostridium sp. D53t1_180928_C8 TaxID=2787101 RepID=UPI0018AAAD70|nr:hypothetical protein [Clostridium sp. D53t1_180928_C8]